MTVLLRAVAGIWFAVFKSKAALIADNVALRHQLDVLLRQGRKPCLNAADRILWVWISKLWRGWKDALVIVKPDTIVAWHRQGFRLYWCWKSRPKGRKPVDRDIRELICGMSVANPLWGAPRIRAELAKLGLKLAENTVAKYMARKRSRKPPSQTWKTFLRNHMDDIAAVDFLTVPTATFKLLYCFVVLSLDRRRVIHFNVTDHPTAQWTARQLLEAFPWDSAPRYLIRDRDGIYGREVQEQIAVLGIEDTPTAPHSPWQNGYIERLNGSIRRECLDHVIILNERHLRRVLADYFDYYNRSRTHLSLDGDAPEGRKVQLPDAGRVVAIPLVGGLHHRYERRTA